MLESWYYRELFEIGDKPVLLGQIVLLILIVFGFALIHRLLKRNYLPTYFKNNLVGRDEGRLLLRLLTYMFISISALAALFLTHLNFLFFKEQSINIDLRLILEAIIIVIFARLLDWMIFNILINKYYSKRDGESSDLTIVQTSKKESSAASIVQYIVYLLAAILILRRFNLDITLYEYSNSVDGVDVAFKLTNIFKAILVFFIARLLVWVVTQLVLYGLYRKQEIDLGVQYALNQLLAYFIYVIAFVLALQSLGLNMTLIWGGAAALLVGLGLGLQDTFNDFFSGIVLLFERTVKIGDVLEIEGTVGTVKKIGLRSSIIEARDNVTIIVPNSKMVNQKMINWTHHDQKVRFSIPVGVAYGSNTPLVKRLLLSAVKSNPYIIESPAPFVRFMGFGDSALEFQLFFFSRNFLVIEDIKSDIRFEIDRLFRENGVAIPFPQRDVWIRKAPEVDKDS